MIKDLIIYVLSILFFLGVIILPIYVYIRKKKSKDVLYYLKLKRNWKKGIIIGFLLSSFYVIALFLKGILNNSLNVNLNIGVRWLYGFSVGILEEVPIRGFLLNMFEEKFSFIISNVLVTVIFVLLHFPAWIVSGTNIFSSSISIAIVSLAYGYLVKEFDSLWITIICHSVFNICIWIGLS